MKINWKYAWNCIIHIMAGITLGYIMFGCKASKTSCEAYGTLNRADTVYLEQIHEHYETDTTYKCVYFPEETFIITYHDTSTQIQTK